MRAHLSSVTVLVCVTPALARAHTPNLPEHAFAVGPSLAYGHVPSAGTGLIYGIDAVYIHRNFWAGAGLRSFETFRADERKFLPYLEGGLWVLVNVGGGYTFDTDTGTGDVGGPHFFVGVPLPLVEKKYGHYYLEPYYRPTFGAAGTVHEVGVLVKWISW